MTCKNCQKNPVWEFTNQQKLCEKCFVNYFERKVKGTIRKYNMPITFVKSKELKAKIINNIIKLLPRRKGNLSTDNLNSISDKIIYEMLYGNSENLKKFLPKNQPLYFISDKEIALYARIKRISGKTENEKRFEKIDLFIERIEKKNPDIRHNIINSVLKLN